MSLRRKRIYWIVTPAAVLMSFFVLKTSSAQQGPDESKYIGSKACLSCHEDAGKPFPRTAHRVLFLEDEAGEKNGCEACHGPGSGHLEEPGENIIKFDKLDPADSSAVCLKCHGRGKVRLWNASTHAEEDKSCTDCHRLHQKDSPLLKAPQPDLCFSCHQTKKGDVSLPSRHPVSEKKVLCSDCHDPHSSLEAEYSGSSAAFRCMSCHQEKLGPFAYEHDPVAENCMACHLPHGSVNKKLLSFKEPSLCLQCHAGAFTVTSHSSTCMNNKACHVSHSSIHGSNNNSKFLW
ncbi:MAG: DmsE family decaheme c-type cytochrome [bacterium]